MRAVAGPAVIALGALGCGGGDDADTTPVNPLPTSTCTKGPRTFPLGAFCLREVSVRVLSGGKWRPTGPDESVETVEGKDMLRFVVSSKQGPIEAFRIHAVTEGEVMLQQGYQSRSFSGAVVVPEELPLDSGDVPIFDAGESGDPQAEVRGISYGSAVLQSAAGQHLVMGALSAERATTGIGMQRRDEGVEINLVYGAQREPLPTDEDGLIKSEPLVLIAAKKANEGLARLVSEITHELPEGTPSPRRPPGGWFSGNEHFAEVDEALIQGHIDLGAEKLVPRGLPLVAIDDGWERAFGDWEANEKFPSGMEAVATAIKAKGLVAGIWMAPFLVEVTSEAAMTLDPMLFVRGDGENPTIHRPAGSTRDCYVLDGTNPAAMALATDAVKKLAAAGYQFFKFDHLYAGAFPGARSKAGVTGTEALRSGLSMLREAAGKDAIINASGAPILPVIGFADSVRVGADTAVAGAALSWPFVAFAARSAAARGFLAPLVWPDADHAQLRLPYSEDEARAAAVAAALTGPSYSLGDDLTTLDPARLDLAFDPAVLDIAQGPKPAVAEDLFASPATEVVGDPVADGMMAGGDGTSAPPPAVFSAVGQSGKTYSIAFSWDAPHGVTVTAK